MIVNGYVKGHKYTGDGTLMIQIRIPSIHGPMNQREYKGRHVRNYVLDKDLPYYPSVLLPHMPNEGEVVSLTSSNDKSTDFTVIGLTGGFYEKNKTNVGE